jgi:hypothetical protein
MMVMLHGFVMAMFFFFDMMMHWMVMVVMLMAHSMTMML